MRQRALSVAYSCFQLIAAATRRKSALWTAFIRLPDAVVSSDQGNLGKHSTKRRTHNLLLASHTFHQRCDFLCPGKSFSRHSWKCSCPADNGYHVSSPLYRPRPLRPQLLQQCLRVLQIARIEPLRKPAVN